MHGIQGRLLRPVNGLLFGLEGVLCDDSSWERWWFRVLGQLGVKTDYSSFCRVWESECLEAVQRGERSLCEAFCRLMLSYGLPSPQVDELALACHARWRQQQEETRLLAGVKSTLTQLSEAGLMMGVLSDSECPSETMRERLNDFGLVDVFASVISSVDLGQTKPRPIGYLRSVRDMGLRPGEVAFVGHRESELHGAAEVGMQTIAFNYEAEARADVFLSGFEQLLDLFAQQDYYAAAG